jgi:copper(I)-binding protein
MALAVSAKSALAEGSNSNVGMEMPMESGGHDHDEHMVSGLPAGLEIGHPMVLVAGPTAKSAAAYMVIENGTGSDDRLVSASAEFARSTSLHTTIFEDDVAKMRPIEGGLNIASGEAHELKRGGDHIMIMGLQKVPNVGETVVLTLTFEKAGSVQVPFMVMDSVPSDEMHHDHH